jgi:hypothetical protein
MISELLQEQIERWRRMRIHLVKPAATEWQRRLDEETYGQVIEKKDDNRFDKSGKF